MSVSTCRVLSIQSHVVHGYVGNRCATFPLQMMGFEVDAINTVHFSNHTGYEVFTGSRLAGEDVAELVRGLEVNGILTGYTHVLTGYIGTVEFAESIKGVITRLQEINPSLQYTCDPVLGDNGKLYVSEEMVPHLRDLVKMSNLATPNQFEAETLTGITIRSMSDAVDACKIILSWGVGRVVLTSVEFESEPSTLHVIGTDGSGTYWDISVPKMDVYLSGTGDLTTALLLGWGAIEESLPRSLEKAIAGVQAAISKTVAHIKLLSQDSASATKSDTMRSKELRIIEARHEIADPVIEFRAVTIPS
eukprot:TRINITY_DN14134_c0_g1_i1.p1 TRINITY_DN14134_c0_g1~~TRINITY_DN14134_c0_g1_i1.p1  ORF type:complete len:316 (+),score=58.74 TRINITY_DN14134_c0_g1_i1:36-950(+)